MTAANAPRRRVCCDTQVGHEHRSCVVTGTNEHGVTMCKCRPFGPVHAWEPGESCSPNRVVPTLHVSAEQHLRPGTRVVVAEDPLPLAPPTGDKQ